MADSTPNVGMLLGKLKPDGLAHKLVTIIATTPPHEAEPAMRALLEQRQREHAGEVADVAAAKA